MKPTTRRILIILGLVLGGLCLIACFAVGGLAAFGPRLYDSMLAQSSLPVGEVAPDFELATLTVDTVRLSQFLGRPVLLSIGATWCPDCLREIPLLQQLHERHPELVILMVDVKEDRETVQAFADKQGLTFPVALDLDGKVYEQYRVLAIPTELLIDEKGVIRARLIERVTADTLPAMLRSAGIEP